MSINVTINILILTKKNYDSEDLKEEDKFFLTLISLKDLVRKNKNQI